jgi:ferric-dicitrate binding protein FerR (iron transport regulator)
MEEQVNGLNAMLRDVATIQRESLARAGVLAQIRARPPVRRALSRRLMSQFASRLPRLRFVFPTLAAAGLCVAWWVARTVPLTFTVAEGGALVSGSRATGPGVGVALGDRLEAPAEGRLPLSFSDGSTVVLDRGALARVVVLEPRGATVQLEKGRADVSVRHRRDTHWHLRAGAFDVSVTGTRFSISWDDKSDALTVVMSEGTVQVSGSKIAPGSPIAVTAGQRFHATARDSRWTLAAATSESDLASSVRAAVTAPATDSPIGGTAPGGPAEAPEGSGDETGAAAAAMPPSARAAAVGSRSWQALARSGHYREALQAVERSGFEKACRKLGSDDLVQLGDVARLARDSSRAEQAYGAARRRFPGNDRPAFAMGLVAFEQRRDFHAAGKWFELYVRQYPNGALAREALGREMESWNRAGDSGRARRAADEYLSEAPTGPYARLARQIASP